MFGFSGLAKISHTPDDAFGLKVKVVHAGIVTPCSKKSDIPEHERMEPSPLCIVLNQLGSFDLELT
jgi:hypothetical protein